MSTGQIEEIWDNTGMEISRAPIEARQLFQSSWLMDLAVIVAIGVGIWIVRRATAHIAVLTLPRAKHGGFFIAVHQAILISAGILIWTIVFHCSAPTGFIRNPVAVASIRQAHFASFLPRIQIGDLERFRQRGGLMIDARFPQDYDVGHIDGAINIPVTIKSEMLGRMMGNTPNTHAIVVYCQSRDCPFAGELAGRLSAIGYQDIYLLDGGYQEWIASRKSSNGFAERITEGR